jgi:hypothetical protein
MGIGHYMRQNRWYDTAILVVFVLALAGATVNHLVDQVRHGWFPYADLYGAPQAFNLYWTSLTFLDAFAVFALCFHVRAGWVMALGILLTDVPINLYATLHIWKLNVIENDALLMQSAFLAFLLVMSRRIWRLTRPGNQAS